MRPFAFLARWLSRKAAPSSLTGNQWTGTSYIDRFQRDREPTNNELLAELKNTAFTCATINAGVCAGFAPRLYVKTDRGQPQPKCLTRKLLPHEEQKLRANKALPRTTTASHQIDEVLDYPILDLFRSPNPFMNQFDLWELTTLYQEVHGSAYWLLEQGAFGVPNEVWILLSQNVTPRRRPRSNSIVDYYEYRTGAQAQEFSPDRIVHFCYPDPRNPYAAGLSPLRAAFEPISLVSDYLAFRKKT